LHYSTYYVSSVDVIKAVKRRLALSLPKGRGFKPNSLIKSQNAWLRSLTVDRQTPVLVMGYVEKTCVRFLGVAPAGNY